MAYIRIWRLYDYVDKFIIIISNTTHSGLRKNYTFMPFEENLRPFMKKVDIVFFDNICNKEAYPTSSSEWCLEQSQRDYGKTYIEQHYNPTENDLFLVSDIDEIFTREGIEYIKKNPPKVFYTIKGSMYFPYYYHKVEDWDSTKFNHIAYSYYKWNKSAAAAYWEFYNKYGQLEADRSIGNIYDFQKANWDNYDAICDTLGAVQLQLALIFDETDSKYRYETIVDATGAFKITVPYGEYYAYIKSENRKGIFMPEMAARFELKKIKLDKPTYIFKENFDKE